MESLSPQSAWSPRQVEAFLDRHRGPLRLAAPARTGFPLICSLWYVFESGRLLCATQRDAAIVRAIESDPRCGFEIATNDPPYLGVRGRGRARIETAGAEGLLARLIDRYLGRRDSPLAQWLLARTDREVVIAIEPEWLTAWDYSERMSGATGD